MSVIDDYLRTVPEAQKRELERIRRIVKQVVPEAEEVLSYGMPTFRLEKKYLIHFAAFKKHMSIFPGTIRFTEDNPPAESVIVDIVLTRLAQISEG